MGKKHLTYTPDEIQNLIRENPNALYLEILENDWMKLEHLKAVDGDNMHAIYLIRSFFNRVKPREKSSKGQYKLL
jgi:hypothetical protein